MNRTYWDFLRDTYAEATGLPTYVVEYLSVLPIIQYAVMGLSTKWIAKRMKVPYDYVESVLIEFLEFTGWDINLEFSPIAIFYQCEKDRDMFIARIEGTYTNVNKGIIYIAFNIANVYDKIKGVLKGYDYF